MIISRFVTKVYRHFWNFYIMQLNMLKNFQIHSFQKTIIPRSKNPVNTNKLILVTTNDTTSIYYKFFQNVKVPSTFSAPMKWKISEKANSENFDHAIFA